MLKGILLVRISNYMPIFSDRFNADEDIDSKDLPDRCTERFYQTWWVCESVTQLNTHFSCSYHLKPCNSESCDPRRGNSQLASIWTFWTTLLSTVQHFWLCQELLWDVLYNVIQSVHRLVYIIAKYRFFIAVSWEDKIKFKQKYEIL